MAPLYAALAGIAVGLVLDALAVRLAVAPDDDGIDGDEQASAGERPPSARAPLHGEAGTMVMPLETPAGALLRRALIVGATAGLFAVAAARYDHAGDLALVTAYLSVLVLCASTDALAFRVPNVVTYPAIVGAIVVGATMPGADIVEVLAGGLLAGGILLLPALFTGGAGMGMGDVKLAAFVGFALGFTHVVAALIFMALGGGLAAVLLLVTRLRRRGEPIPYAPFIAIGGAAALLWQGAAFIDLV